MLRADLCDVRGMCFLTASIYFALRCRTVGLSLLPAAESDALVRLTLSLGSSTTVFVSKLPPMATSTGSLSCLTESNSNSWWTLGGSSVDGASGRQDREALGSPIQHYGVITLLVTPIHHLPIEILREIYLRDQSLD